MAAAAAVGTAGWWAAPGGARYRFRERFGLNPAPYVPDVPTGEIRVVEMQSSHLGEVPLFTAVPEGYGDGAGLPVLVVLHGSSATVQDFAAFGFGEFATAAARAGFPMVIAGTEDGPAGWARSPGADPAAMLREEMPQWLSQRGFDADRRALWGWSRGGHGALNFAISEPGWARAMALFSPALHADDPELELERLSALRELPVGVWCGAQDAFHDGAVALVEALPRRPEIASLTADGGHTRQYWNDQTLPMLKWVQKTLVG